MSKPPNLKDTDPKKGETPGFTKIGEIEKVLIIEMHNKKASGPDEITSDVLQLGEEKSLN